MSIEIKVVTQPQEREAIYQFRYATYIEEMGRVQAYADHQQKIISDLAPNSIRVAKRGKM